MQYHRSYSVDDKTIDARYDTVNTHKLILAYKLTHGDKCQCLSGYCSLLFKDEVFFSQVLRTTQFWLYMVHLCFELCAFDASTILSLTLSMYCNIKWYFLSISSWKKPYNTQFGERWSLFNRRCASFLKLIFDANHCHFK